MDNMLRKALWGFLKPLLQLVTNLLNPDIGEEWLEELKRFLRKEQCWVPKEKQFDSPSAEVDEKFFEPLGEITVDIDQSLTKAQIDGFLTSRQGIYVEEGFNNLFGNALETEVPAQMKLSRFRLVKDMRDSAIRNELPENHIFGAYEFRKLLASELKKQWGGKNGFFRTDDFAEIFYVITDDRKVFVVHVRWSSLGSRWRVRVWDLVGREWPAEYSVSSRN